MKKRMYILSVLTITVIFATSHLKPSVIWHSIDGQDIEFIQEIIPYSEFLTNLVSSTQNNTFFQSTKRHGDDIILTGTEPYETADVITTIRDFLLTYHINTPGQKAKQITLPLELKQKMQELLEFVDFLLLTKGPTQTLLHKIIDQWNPTSCEIESLCYPHLLKYQTGLKKYQFLASLKSNEPLFTFRYYTIQPSQFTYSIADFLAFKPAIFQPDKGLIYKDIDLSNLRIDDLMGLNTIEKQIGEEIKIARCLNLGNNFLTHIDIGTFTGLSQLYCLILAHNQLTHLQPEVFNGLSELAFLNLEDNRLTYLDAKDFAALPKLEYLYLQGNPLPEEIIERLRQQLPHVNISFRL